VSGGRRVAPPSGQPAPVRAELPGGQVADLLGLAEEICRRYRAEFPDERARYGDAGVAWCVHDNQHILNWAVLALHGYADLARELHWLAGVLEARDFPVERLARDLEIAAEVAAEALDTEQGLAVARRLREGAAAVRSR
jgi:hypothetical protein